MCFVDVISADKYSRKALHRGITFNFLDPIQSLGYPKISNDSEADYSVLIFIYLFITSSLHGLFNIQVFRASNGSE
jgi:hypothetical protein